MFIKMTYAIIKLLLVPTILIVFSGNITAHSEAPSGTPSGYVVNKIVPHGVSNVYQSSLAENPSALPVPYDPKNPRAIYPHVRVDGCSSWKTDKPNYVTDAVEGVFEFHSACDKHDMCWGKPRDYNGSAIASAFAEEDRCDNVFLKDMLKSCLDGLSLVSSGFISGASELLFGNSFNIFSNSTTSHNNILDKANLSTMTTRVYHTQMNTNIQPLFTGHYKEIIVIIAPILIPIIPPLIDPIIDPIVGEINNFVDKLETAIGTSIDFVSEIQRYVDAFGNDKLCWLVTPGICLAENAIDQILASGLIDDLKTLIASLFLPIKLLTCALASQTYYTVVTGVNKNARLIGSGSAKQIQKDTKSYIDWVAGKLAPQFSPTPTPTTPPPTGGIKPPGGVVNPAPVNGVDLSMLSLIAPATGAIGGTFTISGTVANLGNKNANGAVNVYPYLSLDTVYDNSDYPFYSGSYSTGLLANSTKSFSFEVAVHPSNTPPGKYYVLGVVDKYNRVVEIDDPNNLNGNNLVLGPQIEIRLTTDLTMLTVSGPSSATLGSVINVNGSFKNSDQLTKVWGTVNVSFFLSSDRAYDTQDRPIGAYSIGNIAIGQTVNFTKNISIPNNIKPGQYNLLAIIDQYNRIREIDDPNNKNGNNLAVGNSINIK